jgi:hypothetical protein
MSGTNRALPLLAVVLVAGLAGCGSSSPPTAPASPALPSSRLPARPAELPLNAVAPCALLTQAQETQLGVRHGNPAVGGDEFNSPVCTWDNLGGPPDNSWLARLITHRGADYALDSTQPTQVVQVDGFAAVQTSSGGQDPTTHCIVLVDVAQGQSLWMQYVNTAGDYPKIDHEVACKLARDAAQLAVDTLHTLAK